MAEIWNPAVEAARSAHREAQKLTGNEEIWWTAGDEDLQRSLELLLPYRFPLGGIAAMKAAQLDDFGSLVFEAAIRAVATDPETHPVLGEISLSQKALCHLWLQICNCQKRHQAGKINAFASGSFSQSVHYLYSARDRFLSLFYSESVFCGPDVSSKRLRFWKQSVAAALCTGKQRAASSTQNNLAPFG